MVSSLPPRRSSGALILSGGMDSVTLLHYLVQELQCTVVALSFDYGQKHVRELECAKKQCTFLGVEHHIVELPFLNTLFQSSLLQSGGNIPEGHYEEETMKQTVVPNRNMIMSSIAAGLAQSRKLDFLSLGVHAGDHAIYPDCRVEFIDALRRVIELSDWHRISVVAPFQHMTKADILRVGYGLTTPVNYRDTWTCYKGASSPCKKCGACTEREEAFLALKKKDPALS